MAPHTGIITQQLHGLQIWAVEWDSNKLDGTYLHGFTPEGCPQLWCVCANGEKHRSAYMTVVIMKTKTLFCVKQKSMQSQLCSPPSASMWSIVPVPLSRLHPSVHGLICIYVHHVCLHTLLRCFCYRWQTSFQASYIHSVEKVMHMKCWLWYSQILNLPQVYLIQTFPTNCTIFHIHSNPYLCSHSCLI